MAQLHQITPQVIRKNSFYPLFSVYGLGKYLETTAVAEKLTWEQWLEEFNRWMTFRHGETSRQADAMILFGQAKSPMTAADLLGATLERVDHRTF